MHVLKKVGIAATAAAVVASALSITLAGSASADTGARNGDIVGVGSDTLQNAVDFLLDGGPGYAGGYNGQGNLNRAFDFFATGDANGRATYDGTCGTPSATTGLGTFCDSTTNQTPNLLPGTVVLRDGDKPVTRPNGSGAGVAALIADGPGSSTNGYQGLPLGSIQFARMSRLPNSSETQGCQPTQPCGGLHVYQVATDNLRIAHKATGYNGPATLTAAQLVAIYTCSATKWTDVGGTSSNTIHPLIPQSGSGTRNFFLADLASANGGNPVTPGTCVRTVEEHDPTGIYADPSPGDAIEPFSTGKLALINSGYFQNAGYSGTGFANGAYTPGFLTTLNNAASYHSSRGLYVVIRNSDLNLATKFQPGGTLNWARTLFAGPTSWVARPANAAAITAAGFTAAYKDCGVNPPSC